jgi:uncharacterized membrane protein
MDDADQHRDTDDPRPSDGHSDSHSDGHGHGPSHAHSHSHGHGHGLDGGWDVWLGVPALRLILSLVILVGILTVIGVAVLWPTGEGREAAIEEAASLGLVTQQYDATVEFVREGPCSYDATNLCRELSFIVLEGPDAVGPEGQGIVVLPEFNLTFGTPAPELAVGDAVMLAYEPTTQTYYYADRNRGTTLVVLTVLFAIVVIALGRARGLLALASMAATVVVLVGFIAPAVLDGRNPVAVAVVAASAIAFFSLYLTHGFNPTTTVALAGTLASLVLTLILSSVFFAAAGFSGLATEEGLTLPLLADINLSSLLLGGAIIGTLGALDDVTVTQVATVAELHNRNRSLSIAQLVTSGVRVGREHIASTVNTLLLAYAGASMPLLLLFAAANQPLGVVANSEVVAVEIVRTLTGSIGLVAAVPITTMMAAVLVGTTSDQVKAAGRDRVVADPGSGGSRPEPTERVRRPAPTRPDASWDDFAPDSDLDV